MLYTYHQTHKTIYDELFFLRDTNKKGLRLLPEYSLNFDPQFSTLNSFTLTKLQAYEQLRDHLQLTIQRLLHPESGLPLPKTQSLWTVSKAALIELAYAMHARGSVNNWKGDISDCKYPGAGL